MNINDINMAAKSGFDNTHTALKQAVKRIAETSHQNLVYSVSRNVQAMAKEAAILAASGLGENVSETA